MGYPKTIQDLIECFKKLPGVGEKTAERYALSCLDMSQDVIDLFSKSIETLKINIKKCEKCHNYTENDICEICSSPFRDKKTLCVVEKQKNVVLLEKLGSYNGLYHVLEGLISPTDGINFENLNIKSLIERIKNDAIKEVIIAIRPSVEGETTALYISKLLEGIDVKVSKIASGVPMGVDMEFIDALTLENALRSRISVE